MTVIDAIETAQNDIQGKKEWSRALVNALGNPAQWTHTGNVNDAGKPIAHCACGHPIRFMFEIIHPDGRQTSVGSECINYFSEAGEIYTSLLETEKRLQERLANAKRAAKAAADAELVQTAKQAYDQLHANLISRYRAYRERGSMAPRNLWWAVASNHGRIPATCPEYQRASQCIKWYVKQSTAINAVLS